MTQAIPLIWGVATGALLTNKGYDADTLPDWLKEHSMTAVIPPKANRQVERNCDWWYLYKGPSQNSEFKARQGFPETTGSRKRRFLNSFCENAGVYGANSLPSFLEKHSWKGDSKNMTFENALRCRGLTFIGGELR